MARPVDDEDNDDSDAEGIATSVLVVDQKLEKHKERIRASRARREELERTAQSEIVLEKQPLMVEDDDDEDMAESLHKGRAAGQREARAAAAAAAAAAGPPATAPPARRGKPVQLKLRVNGGSKDGPHDIQAYSREPAAALRDALAAHIGVNPSAVLKLELDGDRLEFDNTLEGFDLEDGDLIDATVDDSVPARKIVLNVNCNGVTQKFKVTRVSRPLSSSNSLRKEFSLALSHRCSTQTRSQSCSAGQRPP